MYVSLSLSIYIYIYIDDYDTPSLALFSKMPIYIRLHQDI